MSDALNNSDASMGAPPSYQELEGAVLDAAAAIHRLATERDHLRSLMEVQERELISLRATNEELRRELVLIGDSYVRFATSCVTQLR